MSCYLTGVSKHLGKEFGAVMFHDNMDIAGLMVHAEQLK